MTALTIPADSFHTFRVSTPSLGGSPIKIFYPEETKSFSYDEKYIPRDISDLELSLDQIFFECSVSDWDGYGAKPISKDALYEALDFISMIPKSFQLPEIVPEPSGEIGFEWNFGENRILVASVKGTGIVAYASILGNEELRIRGTEILDNTLFQIFKSIINRIS